MPGLDKPRKPISRRPVRPDKKRVKSCSKVETAVKELFTSIRERPKIKEGGGWARNLDYNYTGQQEQNRVVEKQTKSNLKQQEKF